MTLAPSRRFALGFALLLVLLLPGISFSQEGQAEITGTLVQTVGEDFEAGRTIVEWGLEEDAQGPKARRFRLDLAGAADEDLRHGMKIRARGNLKDSTLEVAAAGKGGIEVLSEPAAEALVSGEKKLLVILVNLTDAVLPLACTPAATDDLTFINSTSINYYYQEASFNTVSLSGLVKGPYTVSHSSTQTDKYAIAGAADAAAQADGVTLSTYTYRMYYVPQPSAIWTGSIVGWGTGASSPARSWIRGDYWSKKRVHSHELGHNFGMAHANTPSAEYGDDSCVMGTPSNQVHPNAPHKVQLGWTAGSAITTATSSGTYSVTPLEQAGLGPQAIKFPKPDTNEQYYLSYRIPTGFDAALSSTYYNKLSIHRWSGASYTYFLAAIIPGQTWTDSVNGISVTLTSTTATNATVDLVVPAIPAAAPVLSLSPTSQIRKPGTAASYSLTVTNKDPSGFPGSTFAVSAAPPSGWTWTASPASLTLAPGSSGTSTVTITSASTATQGTYSFSASVSDSGVDVHSKSISGTYKVDTTAPSTPTGLAGSTKQGGKAVTLTWNASTDNMGMGTYVIYRNGVSIASTASTTFKQNPGKGTWTYQVQAKDVAGNLSGLSAGVTLTTKR